MVRSDEATEPWHRPAELAVVRDLLRCDLTDHGLDRRLAELHRVVRVRLQHRGSCLACKCDGGPGRRGLARLDY